MSSNVLRSSGGKEPVDVKGGPFGGMRPDKAPSSIGPTDFISLQNIRRIGGLITNRPGQASFVSPSGEVTGMYDFQSGASAQIMTGGGLFVTLTDGAGGLDNLNTYDPRQLPTIQLRQNQASLVTGVELRATRVLIDGDGDYPTVDCLVVAQNSTVDGTAAKVCRLEAYDPGYSIDTEQIGGTSPITPLVSLPTVAGVTYTIIDSMVQYSNKLFICATSFAGTAWGVFSWDGQTITYESTLAVFGSACTVYRDSLVVFTGTNLRIRNQAGTWSTIATGCTALSTVNPNCVEVYKDILYFCPSGLFGGGFGVAAPTPPHTVQLGAFDGSTVAITYPIGGPPAENKQRLLGLAVYNRYLYMTYNLAIEDPANSCELFLARFDGTTWAITHFQFNNQTTDTVQAPVRAFHGSLYVGQESSIWKSPKKLTAGAWASVQSTLSMPTNMEIH